jgi:hypothetical protein
MFLLLLGQEKQLSGRLNASALASANTMRCSMLAPDPTCSLAMS